MHFVVDRIIIAVYIGVISREELSKMTNYPLFVEGMTKVQIRHAFRWESAISFQHAIELLQRMGFTEFAAEEYLYAEG